MGLFKRFTERAKQKIGVKGTAADWKPTSNARNNAMLEEARKFSKQIKLMHREFKAMENAVGGTFMLTKSVLTAPLPRIYEMTDKGAVPVEKEAGIVGQGVRFDVLSGSAAELKSKMQSEVLHPLDQWQAAYKSIKARNLKCEELRLELDAKRREATHMLVHLEKQKTRSHATMTIARDAESTPGTVGPNAATGKFEDAEWKLQKEEDKVTRLTQRYKDVEQEVFNALVTLITDTKVLKQYAATALVVYQNAFTQAYTAFDGSNEPMAIGGEMPSYKGVTTVSAVDAAKGSPFTASGPSGETQHSTIVYHEATKVPMGVGSVGAAQPSAGAAHAVMPPAWYSEARQNAKTMSYDSDDDH